MVILIIIVFNIGVTKSQIMFYYTLKSVEAATIILGDTVGLLSGTQTYRYLGHTVTITLSHEADNYRRLIEKAKCNLMLLEKFYFCSDLVNTDLLRTA